MGRHKQKKSQNSKKHISMYVSDKLLRHLDAYVVANELQTRSNGLNDLLSQYNEPSKEYLAQLLKENEQLDAILKDGFVHVRRWLNAEITKVKAWLSRPHLVDAPAPAASKKQERAPVRIRVDVDSVGDTDAQIASVSSVPGKRITRVTGRMPKFTIYDKTKKKTPLAGEHEPSNTEPMDDHLYVLVQEETADDDDAVKTFNTKPVRRSQVRVQQERIGFILGNGWTTDEIDRLKRAINACNPVTRDHWLAIARSLSTPRTWEECKMFAENKLGYHPEQPRLLVKRRKEVASVSTSQSTTKEPDVVYDAERRWKNLLKCPPVLETYEPPTSPSGCADGLPFAHAAAMTPAGNNAVCFPSPTKAKFRQERLPIGPEATDKPTVGMTRMSAGDPMARKLANQYIYRVPSSAAKVNVSRSKPPAKRCRVIEIL